MDENRFDEVVRDLPRSFNTPPEPPLDEMWAVIEDAHFNSPTAVSRPRRVAPRSPWLAAAAALVIGIGIGQYLPFGRNAGDGDASRPAVAMNESLPPGADTSAVGDAYRDQTSRYLGQAAALLISLPAKDSSSNADASFAGKAADLSSRRGLLMDSPAAQDPKLRSLLRIWSSCWCRLRDCAAGRAGKISI